MFLQNKYNTWYHYIISSAKNKDRKRLKRNNPEYTYYEEHHTVPKSLGGSDDKENKVFLTAKEHYICHLLLCKMLEGANKYKMVNALIKMTYSKSNGQERYTAKSYSIVRSLIAEKNSFVHKGKPKTEEHKKKISEAKMGVPMSDEFRKSRTQYTRDQWARGVFANRPPITEETKEKIRQARSRQIIPKEVYENLAARARGKKCYTDGTKNIRIFEADGVPSGFVPGMIRLKNLVKN